MNGQLHGALEQERRREEIVRGLPDRSADLPLELTDKLWWGCDEVLEATGTQ